jgi:putative transposase
LFYLRHLRELAARMRCEIHAYCLMTNHVHLLVTPESEKSCAMMMRHLNQQYVRFFNRRYERSGTLWGGRYHSCPAESARYVLACYRYIELNPVRAGMVTHPADYAWSSYLANAGSKEDAMIAPHPEYAALGADEAARRASYRALVSDGLEDSVIGDIREATVGGHPLGSANFKLGVAASTGRRVQAGKAGRPSKSQQ